VVRRSRPRRTTLGERGEIAEQGVEAVHREGFAICGLGAFARGLAVGREAQRASPVAKAEPSPAARRKAARKRADPAAPALAEAVDDPVPVHSFRTLLADLATLTRNTVRLGRDHLTTILATPPRTQHRALDLLGITPTAYTDRHSHRELDQCHVLKSRQSSG